MCDILFIPSDISFPFDYIFFRDNLIQKINMQNRDKKRAYKYHSLLQKIYQNDKKWIGDKKTADLFVIVIDIIDKKIL